jgi:hypothetical protein
MAKGKGDIDYIKVPRDRYELLLDAETRLRIITDMLASRTSLPAATIFTIAGDEYAFDKWRERIERDAKEREEWISTRDITDF